MTCNSCGKIIWPWEPKMWILNSDREWHDNEKCNPNNIHAPKHYIPSAESLNWLNNEFHEVLKRKQLDNKIKKQQENWE